jgi:putative ABC transport system ATP-binding protein
MIVMKEVTRVYEMGSNQVLALNHVNLSLEKGDFLAVMGPSGSGKSTLLYTVGGLLTPTKGDVIVKDTCIYRLDSRKRSKFRRENVGFIFQTFELLPYLTAAENVMLPLYLTGASSIEQENAAKTALYRVGLANRAFHKPAELSGGEQQRVAIARGIVNNPTILLADEPTGNLDQKTGNEIMQLLCKLHVKDALTMIVVTHDPVIAERANKVMHMIDGHVVVNSRLKEAEMK